jgi:predicted 2-oxoglutarate/Fe(II)-dependent dioxygenase YbiX
MPKAEFFQPFGLFIQKKFLEPETCRWLRAEASRGTRSRAGLYRSGMEVMDEAARKTFLSEASPAANLLVRERIEQAQRDIEQFFRLSLEPNEAPQFLIYEPGDFFGPHADRSALPQSSASMRARRLSLVIFLNGEAPGPAEETFEGGQLTFYGLLPGPRTESFGFPLTAEEGLLVVFRADLVHEVTPVTRGRRFTIVDWFRERGAAARAAGERPSS